MSEPTVAIAITAENKVEKGAKAAEKRVGQVAKNAGVAGERAMRQSERSLGRGAKGIVRSFGEVERASSRALGGRSLTAGLTSRLGALGEAASAAGSGLGEAAASGGVLSGALGIVGVAAAATIGVLAAAAYGAFKLADGWAKGAAGIGRTADIIGVSTKALQEFSAAAERAGVDKDKATGSLGGLSQTLNDARYGRNTGALAVLGRLGVQMKTNADGTVDVGAMLPAIATAIQRQNSSGRRTAAKGLGISLDALPAFSQGGAALSADMKDADDHAVVLSQDEIAKGTRIARKSVRVGQLKDLAVSAAGSTAASVAEPGYDATLTGGTAIVDGARNFAGSVDKSFKPAAEKIDRAASRFEGAVNYSGGGGGRLSRQGAIGEARKGVALRDKLIAAGFNQADATALAANSVRESGADYKRGEKGKGERGFGLFQWTNKKRKNDFQQQFGHSIYQSSEAEQIKFLKWELSHTEAAGWRKAHQYGGKAGDIAYGFAAHVERPKNIERDGAERRAVADAMSGATPVTVTIEHKNAPPGTKTTVRSGRGAHPAISHAMAPSNYQGVHGG